MTPRSRALALALLALNVSLVGPARAQAPAAPQTGVLLLRGGEVLEGRISRVGDRYVVSFEKGGEVRLPVSAVEFQAGSLDEVYRRMASRCDVQSAASQLELADWCLRHGRLQQCADRLLAATVLEPNHPRIRGVETRLWLATHPPDTAAASEDPTAFRAAAVSRAVKSVPPGAIESFASDVQPLLLNRCAGCHRPGSKLSFQLIRPLRGRPPPRSFTERNLAATLAVVDRGSPRKSPLVVAPRARHGGTAISDPPLDAAHVKKLAAWIESLTVPPTEVVVQVVGHREGVLWQPGRTLPGGAAGAPAGATRPAKGDSTAREGARPPMGGEKRPGQTAGGFQPRDPFDPEIFNRRYFPAADSP